MTTTTATRELSPVEAAIAPALDAYSAELAAHGHVYGELGSTVRSCRCGFVGKAGRNAGRSVGLHIAAAERAASKRYDAAAKVALDRLAGMTPAQRRELVEAASAPAPAVEVEAAPELVEVEVEPVRFARAADPAPGVRAYEVLRRAAGGEVEVLGTVTNRPGGWWRAVTPAGDYAGSFHRTRAAAAASLIARTELAEQAAAAGVTIPVELVDAAIDEAVGETPAPAPLTLVPATRSELPADLYRAGVRQLAAERLDAARRNLGRPSSTAMALLAGKVELLAFLAGTDEDDVVEDVDDAYLALVEH